MNFYLFTVLYFLKTWCLEKHFAIFKNLTYIHNIKKICLLLDLHNVGYQSYNIHVQLVTTETVTFQ